MKAKGESLKAERGGSRSSRAITASRAGRIKAPTFYRNAKTGALFSDEWYTPAPLVRSLGSFDLDPCAGPLSCHARTNIRHPQCGLSLEWEGRVWLNPPYSNIHEWAAKMEAHGQGIMLVNARTETLWFHNLITKACAVFLHQGRIRFLNSAGEKSSGSPIGSALVAWSEADAHALETSGLKGRLLRLSPSPHPSLSPSSPPP